MWSLLTYFLVNIVIIFAQINNDTIVEIPNGKIRGTNRENHVAFESIPYAEPPVGENRFEPPKPYTKKWKGIRNATTLSNVCMQSALPQTTSNIVLGNEDCLYLNVYTPNLYNNSSYPVIIYVHGGAFLSGSGGEYSAKLLLNATKFVYVNFNYRLGPFGFIATEDEQIPGNMGLKDQLLAIKWVKDNIKIFGGDPDKIILVGESAGGTSVHLQVISGKIDNLVKAVVPISGAGLCPWAINKNPLKETQLLAKYVNCTQNNTKDIKECLKKVNAKDIISSLRIFEGSIIKSLIPFRPTIESNSSSNAFLSEDPELLIKSGKISKLPMLFSYVPDEGVIICAPLMAKKSNGIEIIEDLNDVWPKESSILLYSQNDSYISKLRKLYMGNDRFSAKTYLKFQDMCSDQVFLIDFERSIRFHKDYIDMPVYVSIYDNPSNTGLGNLLANRTDMSFGTGHADDIFLFFDTKILEFLKFTTEDHYAIAKNYLTMYEDLINERTPRFGNVTLNKNTPNASYISQLRIKAKIYQMEMVEHITHKNLNSSYSNGSKLDTLLALKSTKAIMLCVCVYIYVQKYLI